MDKHEQLDPVLKGLDADVATAGSEEDVEALKAQIKSRENAFLPMYLQVCRKVCGLRIYGAEGVCLTQRPQSAKIGLFPSGNLMLFSIQTVWSLRGLSVVDLSKRCGL